MIPLLVYNNTLIDSIEAHPPLLLSISPRPPFSPRSIDDKRSGSFSLLVHLNGFRVKKKQNCSPVESPAKSFPTFGCDAQEKNSDFFLFFIGECCAAPIYWKDPSFIGWRIGSSSKTPRSSLTIKFLTPFILVEFFVCCFVKPTKKWEKNPVSVFFDFLSESKKKIISYIPLHVKDEKKV